MGQYTVKMQINNRTCVIFTLIRLQTFYASISQLSNYRTQIISIQS